MQTKEFLYSILASIVAAVIFEMAGITAWTKYLGLPLEIPIWALPALTLTPIVLSILWFRRYISPSHKDLRLSYEQLQEKSILLETQVEDLRKATSSNEVALAVEKQNSASLQKELLDWQQRGIKLFQPGDTMEEIAGKRFGPEVVELDGKRFLRCVFEGTILKFKGTGPVSFEEDTFSDIRFVMDGPVSNGFALLAAMYASGLPPLITMVENTFAHLRGKSTIAPKNYDPAVKRAQPHV